MLWRIDLLLGKALEANNKYNHCYTTANKQMTISEQQLGKHVPMEMISRLSLGNHP
jgi:hypothetical protein